MNRIFAILAFLLFWGNAIYSQETWNNRFGDINFDEVTPWNSEDCYYVDFNSNGVVIIYYWLNNNTGLWELRFMEIGNNGNENYHNVYALNDESFHSGFNNSGYKTVDGGFVNGGSIRPFNGMGTYPILMRFTPTGDTLWMRRYFDATKSYSADNVVQTTDGGFALSGRTEVSMDNNNPQMFVIRTDSLGNMLWYKEYGDPIDAGEFGGNIAETADGGFMIGAQILPTQTSNSNGYLVRIDSVGNLLWDMQLGSNQFFEGTVFVRALSDGNFILGRGKGVEIVSNDTHTKAQIIKMNDDGDVIWQKTFGRLSFFSTTLTVKENPDGTLIAQGITETENPTNQVSSKVGTLAKFTTDGDSLWMREYSYQPEGTPDAWTIHTLRDVTPLPDGGYAAAGWVNVLNIPEYPGEFFGQDVWVFKTDSMGCIVAGCDTITGIEEMLFEEQQTWFTYGPNPVKNQLNVYLTNITQGLVNDLSFELRNLEGKLIRQFYANEFGGISYMLDIYNQPASIYILLLTDNGKILQSERIIILKE